MTASSKVGQCVKELGLVSSKVGQCMKELGLASSKVGPAVPARPSVGNGRFADHAEDLLDMVATQERQL